MTPNPAPTTQHAIRVDASGGPEVLRWTEVPVPAPGPREVLEFVEAHAPDRIGGRPHALGATP